ncbi:type II toxin-antitoxin system mRNA interferase toxin, RelE/StbE family [Candidatus Woesearchaeota archaeon]|nr:type II toxin-antitoxin system mRNA interferase toxin, RelE/StbE family [Candidatus Woesearchaeota archaeon]
MYEIHIANSRTEKILESYIKVRTDIIEKLKRLKQSPRTECGAHPLHGKLAKRWSCWLGSNIRMIYTINDTNKIIYIEAIGTHKIY